MGNAYRNTSTVWGGMVGVGHREAYHPAGGSQNMLPSDRGELERVVCLEA